MSNSANRTVRRHDQPQPVRHKTRQRVRELISAQPTNSRRYYFNELHEAIEARMEARFGDDWRYIRTNVLHDEFNAHELVRHVSRQFRQSESIALLAIAPTESHVLTSEIVALVRRYRVPVVALTLPFRRKRLFRDAGLPIPPTVASDSSAGTSLLAQAAAMELGFQRSPPRNPTVVVIPGSHTRVDSRFRIRAFDTGLKAAGLSPHFITAQPCMWNYVDAKDEVLRIITQIKNGGHPCSNIDIIFAANDDMALAARDAVLHSVRSGDAVASTCRIYGYDAIAEVCRLIDANDPYLRGTVKQNVEQMATSFCELVELSEQKTLNEIDNRNIKPALVLPDKISIQLSFPEQTPPLPSNLLASPHWLIDDEAARVDNVRVHTLAKARQRGFGIPDPRDPNHIRDKDGRVCRRDTTSQRWWYYQPTLKQS